LAWKIPLLTTVLVATLAPSASALPEISARAAIVIDGISGQVLWGRNIHQRLPQASTTKMMTGIVAFERGLLSDTVVVSKRSSDIAGSSIYLEPGEKLTFEQLLYGVMLNSGNDASNAVAEYVGGSTDRFVGLMNDKVKELGLQNTRYTNPHGLPADDHYSSVYDMAMIARYALANPGFAKIATTKAIEVPGNGRIERRVLVNHNKLLRYFPGAFGGKTGYTSVAGRCFIGSAKRDGRYVIEALLDAPKMWEDAEALLNHGIDNFKSETVAKAGTPIAKVAVQGGRYAQVAAILPQDVSVTVGPSLKGPITTSHDLDSQVQAPIEEGQTLGKFHVKQGDKLIASFPLTAAAAVSAAPPLTTELTPVLGWFLKGGAFSALIFGVVRWRGHRRRVRQQRRRNSRRALLGYSNAIHLNR
jgi:D-alanyl-D-alanine carboxypeptidase (penicillin-binding protein 5/6)